MWKLEFRNGLMGIEMYKEWVMVNTLMGMEDMGWVVGCGGRNGDIGFHEGGDIHGIKKWVCMEERLKRWMKI